MRGGQFVSDFPIARRKGTSQVIFYISVGYADFEFQSGWIENSDLQPCKKKEREYEPSSDKHSPEYGSTLVRPDEESGAPEFEAPSER